MSQGGHGTPPPPPGSGGGRGTPPPQSKDQTRPAEKYCCASGWYALEKRLSCLQIELTVAYTSFCIVVLIKICTR